MINYPSSNNFNTVFFLVVVFIGTGLLLYHAVEITNENAQLKDTLGTLQESMAALDTGNTTLKAENTSLTMENSTLVAENTALAEENSKLKTALEETMAENNSLKAADATELAEMERLRRENIDLRLENLRLEALLGSGDGSGNATFEVDQASLLPTDLGAWSRVALVAMIAAIPFEGLTLYALVKSLRRKRNISSSGHDNGRSLSRKNGTTYVVDSRFVDR